MCMVRHIQSMRKDIVGKSKRIEFMQTQTWPMWNGAIGRKWPTDPPPYTTTLYAHGKEEIVYSQGNPFRLLGKGGRQIGGNFLVVKHEYGSGKLPPRTYSNTSNPNSINGAHYEGPICAYGDGGTGYAQFPAPILPTNSYLDNLGTKLIANVLPTNPLAGLFVSLGELKNEGIPSLAGVATWKNRTHVARSAGDEYLNQQFGWVPLVNELKAFSHSVKNSDELIAQYSRNSGRKIKREITIPVVNTYTTTGDVVGGYPTPNLLEILDNPGASRYNRTETRTSTKIWFEGCFTYYLPPYKPNGDNTQRNEQLANYLYGTRPTPEGLWNLVPWSWAADWVGNFGDNLHNVAAFRSDGLVMLYGYIMYQTVHEVTRTNPYVYFKSYPGSYYSPSATFRTIVKGRRTASPYGFGLNPDTFSDRQWTILAALGLSRGSRQLYS